MARIIKREGTIEEFNEGKIAGAVFKAMQEVGDDATFLEDIVSRVTADVEEHEEIHVEQVQDLVEGNLMLAGLTTVAKAYILYRNKRT